MGIGELFHFILLETQISESRIEKVVGGKRTGGFT